MSEYKTFFGSMKHFNKGGILVIDDDPKKYLFSNYFEVANKSKPWQRTVVAVNQDYNLEVIRAEGTSPWYTADHDEFSVCVDGEVEIELVKPDAPDLVAAGSRGSVKLADDPKGKKMGRIVIRQGHMAMLPKRSAYRFKSAAPAAMLFQTISGPLSEERWAEICLN